MSFLREELDRLNVVPAEDLPYQRNGRSVRVAGLVLMRQRPATAKGITFVTLEDETGIVNLIIHGHTWTKYEQPARRASALIAEGRLERQDEVIRVLVRRLEDLRSRAAELHHKSRRFRSRRSLTRRAMHTSMRLTDQAMAELRSSARASSCKLPSEHAQTHLLINLC